MADRQKRIRVVHLTFDMRIGGTEQVIKTLIENSDPEQFEMSVLCIESPLGPFADALMENGTEVTALSRRPGFDWRLIGRIRRHLRRHGTHILHCHQYTPWVYGTLAAAGTATRVIFTEHGRFYPDSSSWKRRLVNPWLHRLTAATTAISQATRDALVRYENLPGADIRVIYNGIAPLEVNGKDVAKLREELGIGPDTLCLGTIARLDPIKNHVMMLEAFRQVLDAGIDARLLIVGDGEMRPTLEETIDRLTLGEHVIMPGYVREPKNHLAAMDIYLLSSLSEGTSMTLLEAMSLGKPCIVTDAGGNPEIVRHGENGLVTRNDDSEAFATAIVSIAKDPDENARMGETSRRIFDEKFSSRIMTGSFALLYAES